MSGSLAAPADRSPAGWYPDPVRGGAGWRWWDGSRWTTFTEVSRGGAAELGRKPRLPRWLSVPVACTLPIVALGVAGVLFTQPAAVVAGLVPLAIVLPVIGWLDRVEPEPRASRAHAVLWGASVAIVVALIANTLVAVVAGEAASMVLSAPIVEEAAKAAGILWAVRRGEVDGISDGVVYAGWVALGFAVVEDISYFAMASVEGAFVPVFVVRALLTPFAHPLFTIWSGLAIARAVRLGKPIWPHAIWGYVLAVVSHMTWNGSLSLGNITTEIDQDTAGMVVAMAAVLFVALFVATAIAVVRMRRNEQRRFVEAVPGLVLRYNVAPDEASALTSWSRLLAARKGMPRRARRDFDAVHASLARLAMLRARPGPLDPDAERVLVERLDSARAALRQRR